MDSRYKIISNSKLPSLEKQVNDSLQQGWEVYGWPFQDNDGNFVQALTKGTTASGNKVNKVEPPKGTTRKKT